MAGNQLGKTLGGGSEAAYHLTGLYPDWWDGRRFNKPTNGWAAGVTGLSTRDNVQRILLGRVGQEGTGQIPGDSLLSYPSARGVPDLVDHIIVKHVSGGQSCVWLKSYEQGREKWQGETLDWIWYDEEPPLDIFTEGLTRTNVGLGPVWITFTPLLGMSDVVTRFLLAKPEDMEPIDGKGGRVVIRMTLEEAGHYSEAEKAVIRSSYPEHEREAREKGEPVLGSGRVYPIHAELIEEEGQAIPPHWARICGLDIGYDHPTAAVWLAWDRDSDVMHLYDAYRLREATPVIHAAAIKGRGGWIPVAWPHDGLQRDKGSGEAIAAQYREQGLNMLGERATFEDGGSGVEAGVLEILDRMQTGRFKVVKHLSDWWEEFRLYHRKDGLIVKERDDLMAATRYAVMMKRFADVERKPAKKPGARGEPGGWMK